MTKRTTFVTGLTITGEYFFVDQADEEDDQTALELEKFFLSVEDLAVDSLTLEVGRQKLRDLPREWLLSETLDNVRLLYRTDAVVLDASVSREKLVRENLLEPNEEPPINNFVLMVDKQVAENIWLGAYGVHRDERFDEENQLTFLGLRSRGSPAKGLTYWIDTGHVLGTVDQTDVSGWAVDIGVTKTFITPGLHPSITLAYAWGSGDRDPDDDIDHRYRQTGLHENEGPVAGVAKYKYYGEVFEPDLQNLNIFTAGVGISDGSKNSLEFVYHYYRADRFAEELGPSRIDADLTGLSKDIGHEVDVIFGTTEFLGVPWLDARFAAGYFMPGDAFPEETNDNAAFFFVEIIASFERDD